MLLKAKIFETKLQNQKQAMSIYIKCLAFIDQNETENKIQKDIRRNLRVEIMQSIKNCGEKLGESIQFSEITSEQQSIQ